MFLIWNLRGGRGGEHVFNPKHYILPELPKVQAKKENNNHFIIWHKCGWTATFCCLIKSVTDVNVKLLTTSGGSLSKDGEHAFRSNENTLFKPRVWDKFSVLWPRVFCHRAQRVFEIPYFALRGSLHRGYEAGERNKIFSHFSQCSIAMLNCFSS